MIVLLFSISIVEENSSTIKTEPECFSLLVIQDSHRFNKGIKFLILIVFFRYIYSHHTAHMHRTYTRTPPPPATQQLC